MRKNKLSALIIFILIAMAATVFACNEVIVSETRSSLYDSIDSLPHNKVGLLLGTAKTLPGGIENPFFFYRIEAASLLYHTGKVDRLVVSGDNSHKDYNEAEYMRKDLLAAGVPDSCIYLDFAGFRTFDSMLRCRAIFGQSKYTVISQRFHNERAIYIAKHEGMDVVGFDAKDVNKSEGFSTMLRERFARVKVFLDLYILNTQPRFYGDKIEVK